MRGAAALAVATNMRASQAGSTDAARSHVCGRAANLSVTFDGLGRPLIALGLRSWLRDGNGPHAYWWPRPRRLRLALA